MKRTTGLFISLGILLLAVLGYLYYSIFYLRTYSTDDLMFRLPTGVVLSEEQKEFQKIEIQLRNLIVERKLIALPANCFKFRLNGENSTKTQRYFDVTEIHSTTCGADMATSPKITTFVVDTEKNELFEVDYLDPQNLISRGEFFTDTTSSIELSGTYEKKVGNESATIEIKKINDEKLHITGSAWWESANTVNVGEIDETAHITSRGARIEKDCIIEIESKGTVGILVTVPDVPACGWGFNVDFSGTYTKTK